MMSLPMKGYKKLYDAYQQERSKEGNTEAEIAELEQRHNDYYSPYLTFIRDYMPTALNAVYQEIKSP